MDNLSTFLPSGAARPSPNAVHRKGNKAAAECLGLAQKKSGKKKWRGEPKFGVLCGHRGCRLFLLVGRAGDSRGVP
jgi:hypothetical protein